MLPAIAASAGLSMAGSFFGSKSKKKAERAAAERAAALAAQQRLIAESRETEATQANIASIQQQETSNLSNINVSKMVAQSEATAATAGSGLGGTSISDLSTQVTIDAARDRAAAIREANSGIDSARMQLNQNNQNRAFQMQSNGVTTSTSRNVLNTGLMSLGQGLVSSFMK